MQKFISVGVLDSLSHFILKPVNDLDELAAIITAENWSQGLYEGDHRKLSNFYAADFIGLDVDDGPTLDEALILFRPYTHIIATTKSHQKEKNGKIKDRYRVILVLEHLITSVSDYEATWHSLRSKFPFIDAACKDASRFYYPCQEIVSIQYDGIHVPVERAPARAESQKKPLLVTNLTETKLSRATLEFLVSGAPEGSWNISLFKAAKDWQEQGLPEEEFVGRAELVTGSLDEADRKTIESAFSKEPKYEPRVLAEVNSLIIRGQDLMGETLGYLSDKALVKGEPTGVEGLDRLLGGGKRLGEVTAWHAEAKTGKNTLWHYMQCLWFKRALSQGYASRELSPALEVIPDYLSVLSGANARIEDITEANASEYKKLISECPIYFASGYGHFDLHQLRQWVKGLKSLGILYFWFDHLHYMLEDPEDHKAASKLIKEIKELALTEQIHIDIIIQPNKLMDGQKLSLNSIKGGAAMGQAIDNLIILERVKNAETPNIMKLTLDVARSKLCKLGHLFLQYDPQTLSFQEVEPEAAKPAPVEEEYDFENWNSALRKLKSIE